MPQSDKMYSFLLLTTSILFISCGGGDSPSTTETTQTITTQILKADAGDDQNISFGNSIILNGEKSLKGDDKTIEYTWRLNSQIIGSNASIVLDNVAEGTYVYTLTIKNSDNKTSTDSVEIRTYADSIVKLQTTQGDILLKMMSSVAPKAVENFVTHSQKSYYDGVTFHRVIKDFMIQGGDPTGTGMGGESIWGEPFYNEIDENVLFNKPFLLAMANRGGTKTNTSQFFITTKETNFLNGRYTIFGSVIDGKETVTKIENVPTSRQDKPLENQTIIKASLYFKIES